VTVFPCFPQSEGGQREVIFPAKSRVPMATEAVVPVTRKGPLTPIRPFPKKLGILDLLTQAIPKKAFAS